METSKKNGEKTPEEQTQESAKRLKEPSEQFSQMDNEKENVGSHSKEHRLETSPKESQEALPSNKEGSSEKVEHDSDSFEALDPSPWNFTLKWPLTRAERIQELERVAPFYESTPQKDNVAAAIDWHSQFPPDELVPMDIVTFQKGKKIDEADLSLEDGQPWDEGCVEDYMTGHMGPPKPFANAR